LQASHIALHNPALPLRKDTLMTTRLTIYSNSRSGASLASRLNKQASNQVTQEWTYAALISEKNNRGEKDSSSSFVGDLPMEEANAA
jgi:hypothetical protein